MTARGQTRGARRRMRPDDWARLQVVALVAVFSLALVLTVGRLAAYGG